MMMMNGAIHLSVWTRARTILVTGIKYCRILHGIG